MICAISLASISAARQARACLGYDRAAEMGLIDAAIASDATRAEMRAQLVSLRALMRMSEDDFFAYHNATVKALALLGTYRIRLQQGTANSIH
jgi:hypothetical protein